MSLSSILQIGNSGLSAYQLALAVTSENISNVNTPGYTVQQAQLETAPTSTANGGFSLGNGVRVATISRSYDALLQQQLSTANTTQGYDTAKSNVLQQIQPSFNEVANNGLGAAISNFFGSWQDLSLNPSGQAERQAVLTSAQVLTDNFQSITNSLNNTISTQNSSIAPLTTSINSTLTNIAQLNGQIKATQALGGNANELKNQQEQLIQNLSTQMGIKYTENSDGTTDVYVTDNSTSPPAANPPGNYYLVKGNVAGSVNADTTDPKKTVVTVTDAGGGVPSNPLDPTATTPPATPFYASDTSGGQLWATLKLRDVIIPNYQQQVDALANTITTTVNAQQQAGSDLTGTAGIAFFNSKPGPPAVPITGATFGINPALTSTSQIAAAVAGSPAASGDNSNAVAIADLQNTLTMSGPPPTTTFNSYYDSLVSTVGLDVQSSTNTVKQDTAYTQQLTTLQQSNSGVSLDEELTNLVSYQRSYQASAKLISTATDMMDTVLGLIK